VIFCDEVTGKAALALSRDLDVQYKTAFYKTAFVVRRESRLIGVVRMNST
jgi:hypothetical protein